MGPLAAPTCGQRGALGGVRRRLLWSAHWLRWQHRFRAFGWRSVVERPDLITGGERIAIGRGVEIRKGARLEVVGHPAGEAPCLHIGDGTSIHFYFHCGAARRVEIGCNVLIAGRVYVTDHDHDLGRPGAPPLSDRRLIAEPTRIGDDCWLGEGCMVLKGVQLGRGSVVAAGAVLTRSVEPYTVVAGVPARPVKRWDEAAGKWARVSGDGR